MAPPVRPAAVVRVAAITQASAHDIARLLELVGAKMRVDAGEFRIGGLPGHRHVGSGRDHHRDPDFEPDPCARAHARLLLRPAG